MTGPGPLSGNATILPTHRPALRAESAPLPGIAVRRDWALPGERPRRDIPLTIEVHPGFDAMRTRNAARSGRPHRSTRGVAIVAALLALITVAVTVAALVATNPPQPEIVTVEPVDPALGISDVAAVRTTSNGWPLLRIEGVVANGSADRLEVPPIQLSTRDANGTLIALGFAEPATRFLAPGQRTTFTADFSDMGGRGEDIVVTFEDGSPE